MFKLRRGLFAQNPVVDDGGIIYVSEKEVRPAGSSDVGELLRDGLTIAASAVTVLVPLFLVFR